MCQSDLCEPTVGTGFSEAARAKRRAAEIRAGSAMARPDRRPPRVAATSIDGSRRRCAMPAGRSTRGELLAHRLDHPMSARPSIAPAPTSPFIHTETAAPCPASRASLEFRRVIPKNGGQMRTTRECRSRLKRVRAAAPPCAICLGGKSPSATVSRRITGRCSGAQSAGRCGIRSNRRRERIREIPALGEARAGCRMTRRSPHKPLTATPPAGRAPASA